MLKRYAASTRFKSETIESFLEGVRRNLWRQAAELVDEGTH
jgi:hypothetical protein